VTGARAASLVLACREPRAPPPRPACLCALVLSFPIINKPQYHTPGVGDVRVSATGPRREKLVPGCGAHGRPRPPRYDAVPGRLITRWRTHGRSALPRGRAQGRRVPDQGVLPRALMVLRIHLDTCIIFENIPANATIQLYTYTSHGTGNRHGPWAASRRRLDGNSDGDGDAGGSGGSSAVAWTAAARRGCGSAAARTAASRGLGGGSAARRRLGSAARWRLGNGSAAARRRLDGSSAAARTAARTAARAHLSHAKIDHLERASSAKIKGARGERW